MLDVIPFGRALVETEDLDPVYVMLWQADLPPEKLDRWLLAYWCYYHCGTASWIVDQPNYWKAMRRAAASSDYPRGTERRHFRGKLSAESVAWLEGYPGGLEYMLEPLTDGSAHSLAAVMKYVQTWKGFGPWIAFKVADMLDRLGRCTINFTEADTFLFDSPAEGAKLVVERYYNQGVSKQLSFPLATSEAVWAFKYLQDSLGELDAPPRYERRLNGQEFETILCKWKSHLNGRYEVGHDIREIREGLKRFSRWPTSQTLLKGLPKCHV